MYVSPSPPAPPNSPTTPPQTNPPLTPPPFHTAIRLLPPYSTPLTLPSLLACLSAAQSSILASHPSLDTPLPSPWRFASAVILTASPVFRGLGTYRQLSEGLDGLRWLLTREGERRERRGCAWVLSDDVLGIVLRGDIRAGAFGRRLGETGNGSASGNVSASVSFFGTSVKATSAQPTQSVSIVGFEELDSTRVEGGGLGSG